MTNIQSEAHVLKVIKKCLSEHKIFYERLNAVFSNDVGKSDIIGFHNNIFFAIEVKSSTGKQRVGQILFQKKIERSGGKYYIIRNESDLDLLLKDIGVL